MSTARQNSHISVEAEILRDPSNRTLVTELVKLNNEIAQADFDAAQDVLILLTN